MAKRYVSIWFRQLATDWFAIRQRTSAKHTGEIKPDLRSVPLVLRASSHGRMIITAANATAQSKGIDKGMVLADARAITPELHVLDDIPDLAVKLLKRLAEWCIRFSPVVAIDPPDGLLLDATGCTHLWGDDAGYLTDITRKLNARGYDVRVAIADTLGVAWAVARFGVKTVIAPGEHIAALNSLPPEALRLEPETVMVMHKLGLQKFSQIIKIPRPSLRRRFGQYTIMRIDMALGKQEEMIQPVLPVEPYHERLPCLEPIATLTAIEIALDNLLKALCHRLMINQKGLRSAVFKCYRVDGKIEQVDIGTNRPTNNILHINKLFQLKLPSIEPAMGIELFTLDAPKVEDHLPDQKKMWEGSAGLDDLRLAELLDRLAGNLGMNAIHRYVPAEHFWPERSFKRVLSLQETPTVPWRTDKLRPLLLLPKPEPIEVTAPIPDYPPMLFRYKGKIHNITKADGPERIEQEWWIQQGQHRDYYRVEDEEGRRYWLFRSGHYHDVKYQWFLHGFFA